MHEYYYYGNMLVYETMPSPYTDDALSVIEYVYDMGGSPIGMIYFNGLSFFTYYYVKNLQGDIVQLRSWENGLAAA